MVKRLTTTSDKGGLAFTFGLDVTCKPSEMAKILALGERLKAYEDTGLEPDEILCMMLASGDKIDELTAYRALGTVEEFAALKERTRWIPVSERLPDKSGRYLTRDQKGNIHIFDYDPRSEYPFFIGPDHMRYYQPTHWMPLPSAPDSEAANGN